MLEYSSSFKENLLKKVYLKNGQSITAIANESGMPPSTLFTWLYKESKKIVSNPIKPKSNKSRSIIEKFKIVCDLQELSKEEEGKYLRTHGIYSHEIQEFKDELLFELSSTGKVKSNNTDKKRIKELEIDLRRKEKALAEASALLILKKKAAILWGSEGEK